MDTPATSWMSPISSLASISEGSRKHEKKIKAKIAILVLAIRNFKKVKGIAINYLTREGKGKRINDKVMLFFK
jgi:hypothetical protein